MDGTIIILDCSTYERQKMRHIIEKIGSFNIIEVGSMGQFNLLDLEISDLKLIIMNLSFPTEANGFIALKSIKSSENADIPVIVISHSNDREIKAEVLKYSASDYIVKPYQVKRLESSIRSLAGVVRDFHYDTEQINDLRMTFDNYIEREIKFAERSSSPLSLILITTIQINADIESEEQASIDKPFIFSIAVKKARRALRATDTIVLNKGRDILIVLPCTDEHGAQLVSDKIKAEMEPEFEKIKSDLKEYIYPVHVTYPYDGDSFQALMHKAFMQVSSKELLEKIVSIPTDTLNYANKSYSRYQRLI